MTDPIDVKAALAQQRIELPSWAFGNTGTRFKVFAQPGVPRNPYEKIAYATDVRPMLGELRRDLGLDPDPTAAYARSDYAERIVAERAGGAQAGWGA